MDSLKAFDRVYHYLLLKKLFERQVPLIVVRFIIDYILVLVF